MKTRPKKSKPTSKVLQLHVNAQNLRFFYVMRPRLKKQNQVKYSNRSRLDRDLIILQRAIKKVPDRSEDEDWRLSLIIEQFENSNVNIYLNE